MLHAAKTMRLSAGLFLASALLLSAACDKDSSSNKSSGGTPVMSDWTVTEVDHSTLTGAEVPALLNAEPTLAKLVTSSLILPQPISSGLSRLASGISTCVSNHFSKLPVSVTADSLRVDYEVDFATLCDEEPKTDETVTEIDNTASGTLIVSCVGGDFQRLADKTLGEVRSASLCSGSELIHYALDMQYAARKVVETTVLDVTTKQVTIEEARYAYARTDGTACEVRLDDKEYTTGDCRLVFLERTFTGTPQQEALPPSDAAGPRVVAGQAEFGALSFDTGSSYYRDGTVTFWLNGWEGAIDYTNGYAPPRWEAAKETETATGTLGQAFR